MAIERAIPDGPFAFSVSKLQLFLLLGLEYLKLTAAQSGLRSHMLRQEWMFGSLEEECRPCRIKNVCSSRQPGQAANTVRAD